MLPLAYSTEALLLPIVFSAPGRFNHFVVLVIRGQFELNRRQAPHFEQSVSVEATHRVTAVDIETINVDVNVTFWTRRPFKHRTLNQGRCGNGL